MSPSRPRPRGPGRDCLLAGPPGGRGPPPGAGPGHGPHAAAGPGLPGRPAGGAKRKNGWQLAEANGDADPYGIQYLLNRARWAVAAARTALCGYVQEHLGDAQAVGIIDETAFLKKGTHSAGVARQYSGTAGQGGNCQVGVFLAYAGARGTLLDAELYLPKGRLQGVGLAPDTPFRTKPQLAQRLLARAQAAGVSLAWVVGDTVHGHSGQLRSWLEEQDQAYLLAVPAHETFLVGRYEYVVGEVFAALAEGDWQRLRAGPGSKGERWCDWQCLVLAEGADADKGYYLLFRRACAQPEKWQAHLVWGPRPATCPPWSGWPAAAGVSSRPSSWPSRRWAWTSTRCATPGAGTAT